MGLYSAIQQIAETAATAPPAGDPADEQGQHHARYHHRIVFAGSCFAALGVVTGLLSAVAAVSGDKHARPGGLLIAPLMFGAGGFVFGMSMMCLVTPKPFLTDPVGRPWMRMIGTESPLVTRITCGLFGLIVTAPVVGISSP